MNSGPELTTIGSPFIDQPIAMGWNMVTGSLEQPPVTGRKTFRESLIESDLRKPTVRIELFDRRSRLDDARISHEASAVTRLAAPDLIEADQRAAELFAARNLHDCCQGQPRTVHCIDWEHPENNTFTAMERAA